MKEKIHAFIQSNFIFDESKVLKDEDSLIGTGVIDSTGILELISFLEKEFSVRFDDNELIGDNFESVAKIVSHLERKLHSA